MTIRAISDHEARIARGFTLIELLVVIAIIGMLSAVILGSLNAARNKGADATAKTDLAGTRQQAELYYDSNSQTYSGVCALTGTNTIGPQVLAAAKAVGLTSFLYPGAGTISNAVCNDVAYVDPTHPSRWGAQVKMTQGGVYCVDSTGYATSSTVSQITSAIDYTCQ